MIYIQCLYYVECCGTIECFVGVSEHQQDQGVHGDGEDHCSAQPGESLRVSL